MHGTKFWYQVYGQIGPGASASVAFCRIYVPFAYGNGTSTVSNVKYYLEYTGLLVQKHV